MHSRVVLPLLRVCHGRVCQPLGYTVNGYPAYGFYDARSYYSYYFGRTDFGYQDTK